MDDVQLKPSSFNAPLSTQKAECLIDLFGLPDSASVLDVGCGRGELLLRVMKRYGAVGTGVDPDAGELAFARQRAIDRGLAGRLTLVEAKAEDIAWEDGAYDVALCVGAVHAFGDYLDTAKRLASLVKPGGLILLGDLFWRAEPPAEYLGIIGDGWPPFDLNLNSLGTVGESAGLMLMYAVAASQDEWDHFEGAFATWRIRKSMAEPLEADKQAGLSRARRWYGGYLKWGRDCMGFGYFIYQVPVGSASCLRVDYLK
ncbi:MAG: class I SAM-dependent methyltransferase [Phycisphaeraceae bacterium]|nr:class I SAM-dependent methyltransferase [Phycisphaeraceae bacterium]